VQTRKLSTGSVCVKFVGCSPKVVVVCLSCFYLRTLTDIQYALAFVVCFRPSFIYLLPSVRIHSHKTENERKISPCCFIQHKYFCTDSCVFLERNFFSDPEWSGAGIVPTSQVSTSAILLVLLIVANLVHDIVVTCVCIDSHYTVQRVQKLKWHAHSHWSHKPASFIFF